MACKKKLTFYRRLPYCVVCQHHVYDMEKHIKTEGHKRTLRQQEKEAYNQTLKVKEEII